MNVERQMAETQIAIRERCATWVRIFFAENDAAAPFSLIRAVLLFVFSLALTIVWQIWWGGNGWVFFTSLGMVCLSFSRFSGVRQAFPLPDVVFGLIMAQGLHWFLTYVRPSGKVGACDELLLAFDANTFGRGSDFIFGAVLKGHPLVAIFFILVHKALPLALALTYLALPNSSQIRRQYCGLIGLAAVLIFTIMYGLCPGAGPIYAFAGEFPSTVPTLSQPHVRIIEHVELNTTPSGHVAWALLMFWFLRKHCTSKVTNWVAGGFLFATTVATMVTGEHYLIDLILAWPYAVGVWELTVRRWNAAGVCLLLVVLWEIALRAEWALLLSREVAWVLLSATMAVPLLMQRRVSAVESRALRQA
jgi:hypothetical protein